MPSLRVKAVKRWRGSKTGTSSVSGSGDRSLNTVYGLSGYRQLFRILTMLYVPALWLIAFMNNYKWAACSPGMLITIPLLPVFPYIVTGRLPRHLGDGTHLIQGCLALTMALVTGNWPVLGAWGGHCLAWYMAPERGRRYLRMQKKPYIYSLLLCTACYMTYLTCVRSVADQSGLVCYKDPFRKFSFVSCSR